MSLTIDDKKYLAHLPAYVPGALITWYNRNEGIHQRSQHFGIIVCVDASGFTALTRELSKKDKVGIELLTAIINDLFEGLCRAVQSHAGDVLKFAGDALWAAFPKDCRIIDFTTLAFAAVDSLNRKYEHVALNLSLHVGAELGHYELLTLGAKSGRLEIEPHGALLNTVFTACDMAGGNKLVVGRELAKIHNFALLADSQFSEVPVARSANYPKPIHPVPNECSKNVCEALERYVPAEIVTKFKGTNIRGREQSEHRSATVIFAHIGASEASSDLSIETSALQSFVSRCFSAVSDLGGTVARVDPYKAGHKLLVLFGAPIQHDGDELRAIKAATQMVSLATDTIRIRVGVARGRLLCGDVGSVTRCEYTVMGEAVNLAARLMSKASWQEMLIDSSLRENLPEVVHTEEINLNIKGIEKPVPCHRFLSFVDKQTAGSKNETMSVDDQYFPTLSEYWTGASDSKVKIVHLYGVAGCGKTTVAKAFAQTQHCGRIDISCGQAIFFGPGWLTRKLLTILADRIGRSFDDLRRSVDMDWLPLLREVLEIRVEDSSWTSGLSAEVRLAKQRELYATLLAELVAEPLICIIDDFDSADELSRAIILGLTEVQNSHLPLLVLTTQNEKPSLNQDLPCVQIHNPSEDYWWEYFGEQFGSGLREKLFFKQLLHSSDRNPQFLSSYLAALLSKQTLVINPLSGKLELALTEVETSIPGSMSNILLGQFDARTEQERSVLKCLAVGVDGIPISILKTVMPQTSEELTGILTRLVEHNILLFDRTTETYSYIQRGLRDTVYNCIPESVATELHAKFAQSLEESGNAPNMLLAYHFVRAGHSHKAFTYALDAARADLASHSLVSAGQMFRQCVEQFDNTRHVLSHAESLLFHESYSRFLTIEGRYSETYPVLRAWRKISRSANDRKNSELAVLETAGLLWKQSRYRRCRKILTYLLAVTQLPVIRIRGNLLLAEVERRETQFAAAADCAGRALQLALEHGDIESTADAYNKLGLALWGEGKLEAAAECYLKSFSGEQSTNMSLRARSLNNLGIVRWEAGYFKDALHHLNEAVRIYSNIGDRRNEAYASGNLAGLAKILGRFTYSRRLYAQANLIFTRLNDRHAYHYTIGNLGDLALVEGKLDVASQHYHETMTFAREIGDKELESECEVRFGEVAFLKGDWSESRRRFLSGLEQSQAIGSNEYYVRALIGYARLLIGMRNVEEAVSVVRQLQLRTDNTNLRLAQFECTFLQAEIMRVTGRASDAVPLYRNVYSYAEEQSVFELMLKTIARLYELDSSTSAQTCALVSTLAQTFEKENAPLSFDSIKDSAYFAFFATPLQSAFRSAGALQ